MSEQGGSRRALPLAAIALSIGLCAVLLAVDYVPTHDGPQHLFQGFLENHFDDPGAHYDRYLQHGAPVTALGFTALFAPLEALLGWRGAYHTALAIILLLWSWGYYLLARSIDQRRAWLGLLGFATAFGWPLYMGLFSYVLSVALLFVIAAIAIRSAPWTVTVQGALAALLGIQAVVHLFGALASGLVLGALVLSGHAGPRWRRLLGLAAMCLPVLGVLGLLGAGTALEPTVVWLGVGDRLALAGRLLVGGPAWRTWPVMLAAWAGLGLGAARAWQRRSTPVELALLGTAGLLWVGALATPLHLTTWQFFSVRFLPLAALLSSLLLPLEQLRPSHRRASAALLGGFAVLAVGWAAVYTTAVRRRIEPALAGLSDRTPRSGPRLTIVLDPYAGLAGGWSNDAASWRDVPLPFYGPLYNIGMLYALEQGGIPSNLFADNPGLLSFVRRTGPGLRLPPEVARVSLRDPVVLADPGLRRELVTWLAQVGTQFEDLLLYGAPDDVAVLALRGYRADVRTDRLFLGRFRGCQLSAIIAAPPTGTLVVEHGWGDQSARPLTLALDGQGETPLDLGRGLCGDGWLRISLDRDRSRGPSRGDGFCRGADAEAKLHANALPDRPLALRCCLPGGHCPSD